MSPTPRTAREVYTVQWQRYARRWICPQFGQWTEPGVNGLATKAKFIQLLATRLRRRWQHVHRPCQLRVFSKRGRIQFERTYGYDPKRRKG